MITTEIDEATNKQINMELYSSYLCFAMSAYFDNLNLIGFASWMRVQAMEQLAHAKQFYDFLIHRGGRIVPMDIKTPPSEWDSVLDAFEFLNKHEEEITLKINNIEKLAIKLEDDAIITFRQWFLDEQLGDVNAMQDILEDLKNAGNDQEKINKIDQQLSDRHFTPLAKVGIK